MEESLHGYRKLHSGRLTLLYGQGEIRRICLGTVQVVNAVYAAVRDQNWTTLPFRITRERIRELAEGFDIEVEGEYGQGTILYRARMEIRARGHGLKVSYLGRAESFFHRNRIGLCILHPLKECRGKAVHMFHPDGSTSQGRFPDRISPHQPFLNMSGMSWEPAKGISARLKFEGDLFETEDQRNWSDASFKTYCTPLEKPFPVRVERGDDVQQSLTLELETVQELGSAKERGSALERGTAEVPDTGVFRIQPGPGHPLPEIGIAQSNEPAPLTPKEAEQLRTLPLRHLRADLFPGRSGWEEDLAKIFREHQQLGWPVELALHFGAHPGQEVQDFLQKQAEQPLKLIRIMVFDASSLTTDQLLQQVIAPLKKALPGIPAGGGSDANFAKLNRNPPDASQLDFISFNICPQVHAFDELTLVENLEAQPQMVEDARDRFQKPVSVGAVTLKQRFNAVATDKNDPGHSRPETDPRQHTFFAAGWTLGSIRQLALAGTGTITYYETVGPRGILTRSEAPPGATPLFHLFRELASPDPLQVIPSESSRPVEFDGICLRQGSGYKILLANFTKSVQQLSMEGTGTGPESIFILRTNGWEALTGSEALTSTLILEPSGIYKILFAREN
jgi:hypothetical protein